jgi:fido (protein-threonine AMPylation protein)
VPKLIILEKTMSELIFSSSDPKEEYKISKMLREGKVRKIAPRIYSTNLEEEPSEIIKRNILEILGSLYPGAVLSHRSAFEFRPTSTNHIFVTYSYTRKIKLPGLTINFLEGKGAVEGDNKLFGELYVSSKERAFLENLQITKKTGPDSKTLSLPQIEEKLDDIMGTNGEDGLNKIRDRARELSQILEMPREFELLNKIIGALLSTKPSKILKSDLALARAAGFPYDKNRIELFEVLFAYLHNKEFKDRPENNLSASSFRNFAFFEAYFSNYIEGTVFEVAEAKKIIDTGVPLDARGGDSHDVLGTYQLVSDRNEMKMIPADENEFLSILQERHKLLLSARVEKNPGQFKERNNRAGNTFFVDYKLVRGTLMRGFEYLKVLTNPFARAAYMMFLVSEVHPFEDGNGRIARVMMNAELVNQNQCKIIIPTVYRDDYLLTLKKLTNKKDAAPFVQMLSKAHAFSEDLHFDNYDELYNYLLSHNAFYEPDEGRRLIADV